MKKKWSPKWSGSIQPRKQRKFRHNAPLHVRQKFVSANLSTELRKKFGKRSISVRKNDEVIVKRGSFKGTRGSVSRVDLRKGMVYLEEIKTKKVDGSEVLRPIQPSNLVIIKINLDDKRRQAIVERSGKSVIEKKTQKEKTQKEKSQKEKPQKEKTEKEEPEKKTQKAKPAKKPSEKKPSGKGGKR